MLLMLIDANRNLWEHRWVCKCEAVCCNLMHTLGIYYLSTPYGYLSRYLSTPYVFFSRQLEPQPCGLTLIRTRQMASSLYHHITSLIIMIWSGIPHSLARFPTMLLLSGLVYASVLLQAHAVLPEAYIYTSKHPGSTLPYSKTTSVSSVTTRLLLAQRLGLSQYHSLEDADDVAIELLNGFGAAREQIFHDQERGRKTDKLLAFIENVEYPEGVYLICGYDLQWFKP